MITRRQNAFSKLMIAGEYAVLFGSSAIVAAVDREAFCTYFRANEWEFIVDIGAKPSSDHQHPLFLSVNQALADHGFFLPRGKYVLDTSRFFGPHGQKLGLGSSAAATVALCKMACSKNHSLEPSQLYSIAQKAHRHLFGYGSGADIAASLCGGALFFRSSVGPPFIRHQDLASLWQHLVFVDVKKPQSTGDFVEAVLRFRERDPYFIKDFCQSSDQACEQLRDDFDLASSIKTFDTFFSLQSELGLRAQINIISDEHARIFAMAKKWGGSAKPSGAGGGDIALAIVPQENHHDFRQEIIKAGFLPVDLTIAPSSFFPS